MGSSSLSRASQLIRGVRQALEKVTVSEERKYANAVMRPEMAASWTP